MNRLTILLSILTLTINAAADTNLPAFPGAEGFGANTPGGRGGQVLFVTNLNDSGPGSLRAAIETQGPRTVIFRTGGTIRLKSHLRIEHPYITIAGQTAPGGGILIRDAGLYVSTHDVIIRFLRVRIGASTVEKYDTQDCIHIGDGPGVHDVIVDHCSFSWSIDEIASAVSAAHDITFQWCIFAQALRQPLTLHKKRHHAYCLMLGNHPNRVSVHHNLLAHCDHRNPRIQGGTHDFTNNLVYNWGYFTAVFSRDPNTNFVANCYKPGPESRICLPLEEKPADMGKVFAKGNRSVQRPADNLDNWPLTIGTNPAIHRLDQPIPTPPVRTTDADTACRQVLQYAGARRPALDPVDRQFLSDVINGTGKVIDHPEEVGGFPQIAPGRPPKETDNDGMPDHWETAHNLDPQDPSDHNKDRNRDGYTNLEEYLNAIAAACNPITTTVAKPSDPAFPKPETINLTSKDIPSNTHPFLFRTKDQLKQARQRMQHNRYRKALDTLNSEADAAGDTPLESTDNAWWQKAKHQTWHETYPVIFEKTWLQPARMIRPAHYAALRFALTQNPQDAQTATRLLLHLKDYTFEYEHYDVGMNYSVWGYMALDIYDILHDRFTPRQKSDLDAFFTRMARAVLANDIYWIENDIGGGINNHLAWHKMMLGALGLFYHRPDLVDFALYGPRGIVPLLDDGLVDDGLWCESSLNYHFTAVVPMIQLAAALRNTDHRHDLFTLTTPNNRSLKQPFDAMFGVLFPDGSIPPIGDTYGRIKKLNTEFAYHRMQSIYRDPHFAWLLKDAPADRPELLFTGIDTSNAQPPQIKSRLYPEHGYAFLRNRADDQYWNTDAWCAFLTFDKSGVHANHDKLSLMLFAHGKLLTPDIESRATAAHAFSSQVQRQLNRSALSQNTVMVDYRDQRSTPQLLSLLEFPARGPGESATAVDHLGLLYEGVKQSRSVILTDDYVLDVFQLAADTPRTFHWITHTLGRYDSLQSSLPLKSTDRQLPPPGQWLRNLKQATSDDTITLQSSEDDVNLKITIAASPDTTLLTCGYPLTDQPDSPAIPMILLERKTSATTYAVLYQAARQPLPQLHLQQKPTDSNDLLFEVSAPSLNRTHRIKRLP